jgi:hypothetical protein
MTLQVFADTLRKRAEKSPGMLPSGPSETRPVFAEYAGWMFGYSLAKNMPYQQHLSMTLHPKGRGSTVEDWSFLGAALAVFRVPENVMHANDAQVRSAPNSVFQYMW